MRIGLALPHYGFSFPDGGDLTWDRMLDAATRAEALGFDSVWISDHFFLDLERYGGPAEPFASVEPFTALAALAAGTSKLRLGTLVACAPFRHPAHVAKMSTAIDLISGGRFELGIGAGWYAREFDAFGYQFGSIGERFAALEDSVGAIAALFGQDPANFTGRSVELRRAHNHPRPSQAGGPPIWVGGKGGDRLLRLIARRASGWNTVWRWTPEAHASRVGALRRIAEEEGRDPSSVRVSLGLYALVGEDRKDLQARYGQLQRWTPGGAIDGMSLDEYGRDALVGTPEKCLERLGTFAAGGVEETIVGVASLPFAVYDWSAVELLAESLIPKAHSL